MKKQNVSNQIQLINLSVIYLSRVVNLVQMGEVCICTVGILRSV